MRWNCPHCATSLENPAAESSTSQWTHSQCSKCSGLALVRRADGKTIKLGGSPAPAKVEPKATVPTAIRRGSAGPMAFVAFGGAAVLLGSATAAWLIARSSNPPPAQVASQQPGAPAQPADSDTIRDSALAAPIRAIEPGRRIDDPAPIPGLRARPTRASIELRGGPGNEFPVVGLADAKFAYPVVQWKNRWFRLKVATATDGTSAWVHGSAIELVSPEPSK